MYWKSIPLESIISGNIIYFDYEKERSLQENM